MPSEIESRYEPSSLEERIEAFWIKNNIYLRSKEKNKNNKPFFFVDGPPYTTGNIHLGTAWNKVIKDVVLRYRSMNGDYLIDRAGWDMHGLPIEVKIEEKLGFRSKKDIEQFGVAEFTDACKRFALDNLAEMTEQFKRLGVWLDWEDPYMTLKNEYIEAAWWTMKRADEKDLLFEGYRVVNWCPRCETAIADAEVEYADKTDPSIFVKFPIIGSGENASILIWTTTPWTIPSNIAVAINPAFEYAKVKAYREGKSEILIFAHDLIEPVLKKARYEDYEVLERFSGEDLVGVRYEHPLADLIPKQCEFDHSVYPAEFVEMDNTGCVHIAPGHGPDDFNLGQKYGLVVFCPVEEDGTYSEDAGEYAGLNVQSVHERVLSDLEDRGRLLWREDVTHRYGHCWRCQTPIIYRATRQWFLRISELKDAMLAEIKKVKWYPEWAGLSRFYDWVAGAEDWCISRQRYWGIPLPIWICDLCRASKVIGGMAELRELGGIEDEIELHRPYVDEIEIRCSECGGVMHRVADVCDVWFDSAVASWATLRFPAVKEDFNKLWPADWITEGHDQTRGWFYSQLGASVISFGVAPYKSVLMHGFTLDNLGNKMSKSLGNMVEPVEVISRYGVDSLRIYLLSSSAPWDDLKFNWNEVAIRNRMLNILWNVYRFPLPYMILDEFNPEEISADQINQHLRIEDRWMLSRINSLIRKVDEMMAVYELHRAARSIETFVLEDLSRWYVQLTRPRTWIEKDDPDKLAAYWTLYETMRLLTLTMAPFTPFITEEIYQNLVRGFDKNAPDSVHLCDWPGVDESAIDPVLEKSMEIAREIVEAASNARQKLKRKLRWPVEEVVVVSSSEEVKEAVRILSDVIAKQTNTRKITLLDEGEMWDRLSLEVVPDPSKIGPVFKKDAGKVIKMLKECDAISLKQALEEDGSYNLDDVTTVTDEMVRFREVTPDDVSVSEFREGIVYVDCVLTDEIRAEGFAREIVRRVQEMRKEMNLKMDDRVDLTLLIPDEEIRKLISPWIDHISGEVRASSIAVGGDLVLSGEHIREWDVEGFRITISLSCARDEDE
ncbi:MAG: isoleucyl-tRNA ligase [Candidatus Syntrophoarchaeum caldarius]|uniref:Isoleucine--tRNA ligase n=1 Tax=Candidatus Syntropharchaeum caldarium TaxID=1838285 RepID=A0A1F2PA48_9EURY|nr:MAG: isoleucyl-tRNA ligase [Candidatus Syntrophoarchaeum caldarius]